MRGSRVSLSALPACLGLLLAAQPLLHAGGPGKGSISGHPGGGFASLEAKYNLTQFMGEPMVSGVFKWEAQPGYSPAMAPDAVMWLKVRSGTSFAYINCAPTVPDAGKGFGMDMTGSPDWKDVLVLEFSGSKALRTLDAKDAKAFWKAGFEVVDVVISRFPDREGAKSAKGGPGTDAAPGSSRSQTPGGGSTAGSGPGSAPAAGPGQAMVHPAPARNTGAAPPSLSRLAPGIIAAPHIGPPGTIADRPAAPKPATAPAPAPAHGASLPAPAKPPAPARPPVAVPPGKAPTPQAPPPSSVRPPDASAAPSVRPPAPVPLAEAGRPQVRPTTAPAPAQGGSEAQRRQAEAQRAQAEAQRAQAETQRARIEAQQRADAERRREAEAEAQRRKQAEAREAEAARKREAEAERRREEAQRAREAEAERKREAEAARRREQEEQRRREQEEQRRREQALRKKP